MVALDALVLLGLLDDDDLVDAALAGGSDGAEVKYLHDNTRIRLNFEKLENDCSNVA